jgi:hypothetical protein
MRFSRHWLSESRFFDLLTLMWVCGHFGQVYPFELYSIQVANCSFLATFKLVEPRQFASGPPQVPAIVSHGG